ncbi:hypothetical protein CHARACLAT_030099 [Characodon lateralis]|uniref:Uncharacterized protein n=1 Tax=Characodon lateralis TaxID=208331 RepID=A0ABU7D589_9TELE|nr:hypothetical protein [Characodon lateralis]
MTPHTSETTAPQHTLRPSSSSAPSLSCCSIFSARLSSDRTAGIISYSSPAHRISKRMELHCRTPAVLLLLLVPGTK